MNVAACFLAISSLILAFLSQNVHQGRILIKTPNGMTQTVMVPSRVQDSTLYVCVGADIGDLCSQSSQLGYFSLTIDPGSPPHRDDFTVETPPKIDEQIMFVLNYMIATDLRWQKFLTNGTFQSEAMVVAGTPEGPLPGMIVRHKFKTAVLVCEPGQCQKDPLLDPKTPKKPISYVDPAADACEAFGLGCEKNAAIEMGYQALFFVGPGLVFTVIVLLGRDLPHEHEQQAESKKPPTKNPTHTSTLTPTPPPTTVEPFNHVHGQQAWIDFWVYTLRYLTSRSLFKVSILSKTLNDLVWKILIPASEAGMSFGEKVPHKTIQSYISRLPSLKHLNLESFKKDDVLDVMKDFTKLASIYLPAVPIFPFAKVSHLTNLTNINSALGPPLPAGFDLQVFVNLRELYLACPSGEPFPHIGRLTQLEKLLILCQQEDAIHHVANLTRLKILNLGKSLFHSLGGDGTHHDIGLGELTSLTSLSLNYIRVSRNGIENLTNLQHLDFSDLVPREKPMICEATQALTNLTNLRLMEWRRPILDTDFQYLSTLEKLSHILLHSGGSKGLPASVYTQLPKLPSLTDLDLLEEVEDEATLAILGSLTNLRRLHAGINSLGIISDMTNLVELSLHEEDPDDQIPFVHLAPLTNLQVLRLPMPLRFSRELQFLTNLTELSIRKSINQRALEYMDFMTKLTSLRLVVSQRGQTEVIAKNFIGLISLNLSDSPLPYQEELRPLLQLTRLETLRLERTPLSASRFWEDYYKIH